MQCLQGNLVSITLIANCHGCLVLPRSRRGSLSLKSTSAFIFCPALRLSSWNMGNLWVGQFRSLMVSSRYQKNKCFDVRLKDRQRGRLSSLLKKYLVSYLFVSKITMILTSGSIPPLLAKRGTIIAAVFFCVEFYDRPNPNQH